MPKRSWRRSKQEGDPLHPVMPLLQAHHLAKMFHVEQHFGKNSAPIHAVNDVSLTIEAGETLGLVGESGSGKSTLGRMLLRLIEPDSGQVIFDSHDVLRASGSDLRRLRRDMQIIFQDPFGSLDPRMTVEQTVCEPIAIHGSQSDRPRRELATEVMRAVGLDASALRALSARVQRRPAPAYRDRPRTDPAAALHRRRRARLRSRRERGSADRQPAEAAPAGVSADVPVHLAFHPDRALSRRPHRRHAARRTGGGGYHATDHNRTTASVYQNAVGRDAGDGRIRPRSASDRLAWNSEAALNP